MVQHNEQHTESGKLIEDAGALRSGLCDLISSLPKVDYWQTGQSTTDYITHMHKHSPKHTRIHIPQCYQYTGMLVAMKAGARP